MGLKDTLIESLKEEGYFVIQKHKLQGLKTSVNELKHLIKELDDFFKLDSLNIEDDYKEEKDFSALDVEEEITKIDIAETKKELDSRVVETPAITNELTGTDLRIYAAIAAGEETLEEIASATKTPKTATQFYLNRLIKKDCIYKQSDKYYCTEKMG